MNKGMYTKLAFTNMKNSRQFYLPYLLTGILTVAMYYIMRGLNNNPDLDTLQGADSIRMILGLGCGVIGIFAVIFLFYTNSFLIKRRKRELGIYNILGMEKRHISRVLLLETLFTALLAIGGGLITGIVFNKLVCMLLYRLLVYHGEIGFYISGEGIGNTVLLFGGIYLLTLIYNMMQIKLSKPVELLHGGNVGEKEPKTKVLLTLIGILSIGAGYYMAITTENPMQAFTLFFVAVVLVIIGTYSLFTAGSIAVLKLLRKKKSYYYKTRHFGAVSGMLYRMKQNAVGLANICILSTMVLVMVSATVSMYFGVEDELKTRYPHDISITVNCDKIDTDVEGLRQGAEQLIAGKGRTLEKAGGHMELTFAGSLVDEKIQLDPARMNGSLSGMTLLGVVTRDTYQEEFGEELPELRHGEIVLCSKRPIEREEFVIDENSYPIKKIVNGLAGSEDYMTDMVDDVFYLVVADQAAMDELYQLQKAAYGENASLYNYEMNFDIDGTTEEKAAVGTAMVSVVQEWSAAQPPEAGMIRAYSECRQANEDEVRSLYGGFLFLGLFLGILFLMITVLIIFYKQISEGYDDRERFAIMEKVGMSNEEVKATIRSQIRTVFFLPLVTAAIHVAAAFPMLRRLLALLNLTNVGLFGICMAASVLVFAFIYLLVFLLTSRTYYRIVGEQI